MLFYTSRIILYSKHLCSLVHVLSAFIPPDYFSEYPGHARSSKDKPLRIAEIGFFYRPDDLPATKSCLSIEGKFIFITKAKGHETLASLLVAFHALDVVINESFQYAMSVTVINDVL